MKKLSVLLVLMLLFSACNNGGVENKKDDVTIVVDKDDNKIKIDKQLNTIVSTAPSNTEILIGLGLEDKIVAVDSFSPIDELNEDVLVIDFTNPDIEAILDLNPDIIIASEINIVGDNNPFKLLEESGVIVVYVSTSTQISDVYEDIMFMGTVFQKESEAIKIVDDMKQEIKSISETAMQIDESKTVYFELGNYDGMLYSLGKNTFIDDMINTVGATNIFADQDSWISVSAEQIIERNPDVIITNDSYTPDVVNEIMSREGFETINAVKNGKVYVVDANTTSRGSQLLVSGLKQVAHAIYNEQYEKE